MQRLKSILGIKRIPQIISISLLLDMVLCLTYVITHLAMSSYFEDTEIWDLDLESSIASWYSTLKFLSIFWVATLFSRNQFSQGQKSLSVIVLPTIFLLMAIDECFQIHEWIGKHSDVLLPTGNRADTPFQETGIWMFLVGIPFLAFFLLWIYWLRKKLVDHRSSITMLVIGVTVLLTGALGFEIISNFLEGSLWRAGVALEEGCEMVGATIVLWAVCNMHKQKRPARPALS
ncbi:MAG: hypothetical protein AAGF01_22750 [Cyanobacteria bacterium P01_G01_bin.38]